MTDFIPKYIGGEICEIDDQPYTSPSSSQFENLFPYFVNNKKLYFFETGTDSLSAILNSTSHSKRLLIPENYCFETLNRLVLKINFKIEIKTYKDVQQLEKIITENDSVLILHYNIFSPKKRNDIIEICNENNAISIEDFVHSPIEISQFQSDFAFNSFRKFMAKEVSMVYGKIKKSIFQNQSKYFTIKKQAVKLKENYLKENQQNEKTEHHYLKLFKNAEETLLQNNIYLAEENEIKKLKFVDFEKILKRRRENYQFLYDKLSQLNKFEITEGDYMYFMIKTDNRNELREKCFKNGVFPAIHWIDSKSDLRNKTLSFHIDHRYNTSDLSRIIEIIEN